MRVLLDTNVLIAREDPSSPREDLTELLRTLATRSGQVVIHPLTANELDGDGDFERRAVTQAKARCYPELASPPIPSPEFMALVGAPTGSHDQNDLALLYALKCDAVDILVTEDRGLIRRAAKAGLDSRTLSIREAAEYVVALFAERLPPAQRIVRSEPVHSLVPFLDKGDPLFETILSDYSEFGEWLRRVAREGRNCIWVPAPDGTLGAVLIYKDETAPLGGDTGLPSGRRLKLCTFKVSQKLARQRISELLLAWALGYGFRNRFEETYLTIFPEHELLIAVLEAFGFEQAGTQKKNGRTELLYLKRLRAPPSVPLAAADQYYRRYFPSFRDDVAVRKFLVPIQPAWHARLFPEYREDPRQARLDDFVDQQAELSDPAGNAIRKAYLCHSPNRSAAPGDLLLFYRSQGDRRVTHLAVVEATKLCITTEEVVKFVGNRTVIPLNQIESMCSRSPVLALLFWNTGPISAEQPRGVPLPQDTPWPQSISEIGEKGYRQLRS